MSQGLPCRPEVLQMNPTRRQEEAQEFNWCFFHVFVEALSEMTGVFTVFCLNALFFHLCHMFVSVCVCVLRWNHAPQMFVREWASLSQIPELKTYQPCR